MARPLRVIHAVILLFCVVLTVAKTFQPCELMQELIMQGFKENHISDWMCLIQAESSMRTEAIGGPDDDGSFDYGLFQINDRYWCSSNHLPGRGCNVRCDDLLTNNITVASECAQKIYRQQGFSAWLGWKRECRDNKLHTFHC